MSTIYFRNKNETQLSPVSDEHPLPVEVLQAAPVPTVGMAALVPVYLTVPTDAQDASDVVAATQEVLDCARVPGGVVELQSIVLVDTDDQKAIIDLVFFDANVALGTEDSAASITDQAARDHFLGRVAIAAADYLDVTDSSVVNLKNIGLILKAAEGTTSLFMAAVLGNSTPTYTSGLISVKLGLKRY